MLDTTCGHILSNTMNTTCTANTVNRTSYSKKQQRTDRRTDKSLGPTNARPTEQIKKCTAHNYTRLHSFAPASSCDRLRLWKNFSGWRLYDKCWALLTTDNFLKVGKKSTMHKFQLFKLCMRTNLPLDNWYYKLQLLHWFTWNASTIVERNRTTTTVAIKNIAGLYIFVCEPNFFLLVNVQFQSGQKDSTQECCLLV